jgi:hypothetical protein
LKGRGLAADFGRAYQHLELAEGLATAAYFDVDQLAGLVTSFILHGVSGPMIG